MLLSDSIQYRMQNLPLRKPAGVARSNVECLCAPLLCTECKGEDRVSPDGKVANLIA